MNKLKRAMLRAEEAGSEGRDDPAEAGAEVVALRPPEPASTEPERPRQPEAWPGACETIPLLDAEALATHKRLAEPLRMLRTQVLDRLEAIGGDSLLIAGCGPGEGSGTTALHLAASLALDLLRPTLLVQAARPRPSGRRRPPGRGLPGLTEYLTGEEELEGVWHPTAVPHLGVVLRGSPAPPLSGLADTARMAALPHRARALCPGVVLVVDAPCVQGSAGALQLSRFVHGVLLLAEAERTRPEDVRQAVEVLRDRPLLGVVLDGWRGDRG